MSKSQAPSPNLDSVLFVYDAVGNDIFMMDKNGSQRFVYDGLDRLDTLHYYNRQRIHYEYDLVGNRTLLKVSKATSPFTIHFEQSYTLYDEANRLKETWANGELYTLDYWDTGQVKKIFYPNNTWEDYTLTSRNFIQSVISKKQVGPGTTDLFSHVFTYNELGDRKITSLKLKKPSGPDIIGTVNYTYDAIRRLTTAAYSGINQNRTVNFVYDPVGNRMIRTQPDVNYAYNLPNNHLTSSDDGWNYSYDNNGNLTSKSTLVQSFNFTYDFENRNAKVRMMPQPDSLIFAYSGLGSRIQKISKSGSVVDTTWYVYDGIYAVCEFSGSDSLKASYVYSNGLLLARTSPPVIIPGPNIYYHHDGLGSIVGMTDQMSNVSQTYLYDDFGSLIDSAGTVTNSYLYTGQEWDGAVSGLYNYRARYYDATIGRFNQEDPSRQSAFSLTPCVQCGLAYSPKLLINYFPQELDVYIYVRNNSINFNDPEGFEGVAPLVGGPFDPPPAFPPSANPPCPNGRGFSSPEECYIFFASEYERWCDPKAPKWRGPWGRYIRPPHCPFYRISWWAKCQRDWRTICP